MPLIDKTYFIGELNIPNTDKEAVSDRLDFFIEKYEQKFLRQALPYDLYDDYRNGNVDDEIFFGTEYTFNRQWFRWEGLIIAPLGGTATLNSAASHEAIVGRGQAFDPLPGALSVLIPPAFVGQQFTISRRGPGQLRRDEYTVVGNVFSLISPDNFSAGETFFYNKQASVTLTAPSTFNPRSIIANYIYYHWMRDNVTKSAGIGEVKPKGENSKPVNNVTKMTSAWNQMVEQMQCLWHYLQSTQSKTLRNYGYEVVPYTNRFRRVEIFVPINDLNI